PFAKPPRGLATRDRTGDPGIASAGVARGTRRDFFARYGVRVARAVTVAPAHQIDVDVVVVIDVRTRRQHPGEFTPSGRLYVAQKPRLFRQAMPAVLHRDLASVGEREGGDVERVAEGVLGDAGARIAVHAATGISGNLPDLGNRRTEPAHRRRLHRAGNPAFEFGNHRACERRRGAYRNRGRYRRATARGP